MKAGAKPTFCASQKSQDMCVSSHAEWADVANAYVTNTLNINLKDYKHKIYVIPEGLCTENWAGLARVGCVFDDCRVWIKGDHVEVSIEVQTIAWPVIAGVQQTMPQSTGP